MQNKKLDKSLLPKPQHPLGWKRGKLQISTSTANNMLEQQSNIDQAPTRKNSQSIQNSNPFSNKYLQSSPTPQNSQSRESYRQSRDSRGLQSMSPSQYSLEQKQLMTFAANRSNGSSQRIDVSNQKQGINTANESVRRRNNFLRGQNSSQQGSKNGNRSQSKNKEHRQRIYRHSIQDQEFISYSVVTKQSKSGMFQNQKLLVLNSQKRQLSYYSNLPKLLPFSSFEQMQENYFNGNKAKETVDLDKARRFMFVPAKGNLAGVVVSYVGESGERKEWRLGLGNNAVMNEWIETVNEVVKKQHLSIVKSQVKYPPKPKRQSELKSNNYQTKFTKTLKQQVLPSLIRDSRLSSPIGNSSLKTSNAKTTKHQPSTPTKSTEKQYLVDKSKFVNTKNYVIDLEDARQQDIFYEPPPMVQKKEEQKLNPNNKASQQNQSKNSLKSPLMTDQQPSDKSRFSQQLFKKEKMINSEHQNRISTFMEQQQIMKKKSQPPSQKPRHQVVSQKFALGRKPSSERLSQNSQKDLHLNVDSKISFDEYVSHDEKDKEKETANKQGQNKKQHQQKVNNTKEQKPTSISAVSHHPSVNNQPKTPRKRGLTELVIETDKVQNRLSQQQQRTNQEAFTKSQAVPKTHNQSIKQAKHIHDSRYIVNSVQQSQKPVSQHFQIEDIIVGGGLNQSYVLNFSPHSLNNNWFRLWIETEPSNKVQIYTAFVKACKTIVTKLIDSPQKFTNCFVMTENNTHIIFNIENITFKVPFKLHLPHGLGEFVSLIDFIRSEDFLCQVFKYRREIEDEFQNYQFILNQLNTQFNNGPLSMPIYLPMCCLIKYKGVSVLCKPSIESSNLKIHKIHRAQYSRFQSELEYVEQICHVGFGLSNQQLLRFDLYQIYLGSFKKSIIYMDNLTKYLPMMINPLQKSMASNLQLNRAYIQQNIKTGMISQKKDNEQIESHLKQNVVKKVAVEIESGNSLFEGDSIVDQKGLRPEYLGMVYNRLLERQHSTDKPQKLDMNVSLMLTEIILNEYLKACDIYMMKQYLKQLSFSLDKVNQPSTKSNHSQFSSSNASYNTKTVQNMQWNYGDSKEISFGQGFSSAVVQMLHLLMCKNTKVWSVLAAVIGQKYGIAEFKTTVNSNPRAMVDKLMKKVSIQFMITRFLAKIYASVEVKSWSSSSNWLTMPISDSNMSISPKHVINCYNLGLFSHQYDVLSKQFQRRQSGVDSPQDNLYVRIMQVLNISEETYHGESHLLKSSEYELLDLGFESQKQLIDLSLSQFIPPVHSKSSHLGKDKIIQIYKKLLVESQGRKSDNSKSINYQISMNGIKWLIMQKQAALAEVLIEQQLESINIWFTTHLIPIKAKLLDLASLFFHKKLGNKNNFAVQYSLNSLKLALQHKYLFKMSQIAEKSFLSANVHFQTQNYQKALELYELTQKLITQAHKNETQRQNNLSIEFLYIHLKKAKIKLTTGKTTDSLYSCLQCLRRCEQFEEVIVNLQNQDYKMIEQLQQIQLQAFEIIFRCYEVTKNLDDMRRIAKLCCRKFIEDKILIMRIHHRVSSKSLDDSVGSKMMQSIFKMCWMSLISECLQKKLSSKNKDIDKRPFVPLPQTVKSFCLSGAFSQLSKQSPQRHYEVLQELKQKILAMCRLYPQRRYDNDTMTAYVCRQIMSNSSRISSNNSMAKHQYQLVGKNHVDQLFSSRIQKLIKTSIKQHEYSDSVLYEMLSQVLDGMVQDRNKSSTPRNSFERFAPSVSFTQHKRSRSKEERKSSFQKQSQPQTSVKNQSSRFSQFYASKEASVLPFSLEPSNDQKQFWPELRMSYHKQDTRSNIKIPDYNIHALKDQTDKGYMLIEAMLTLCGREFILGSLQDLIQREKTKYNKNKQARDYNKLCMFYD